MINVVIFPCSGLYPNTKYDVSIISVNEPSKRHSKKALTGEFIIEAQFPIGDDSDLDDFSALLSILVLDFINLNVMFS